MLFIRLNARYANVRAETRDRRTDRQTDGRWV